MVLTKAAKADQFYKSYRDHYSTPMKVTAVKGKGYVVGGTSYGRARLKKVPAVDKKSLALMAKRTAKKKPSLAEKKAKAATRKEAREIEKAHFKAQPRSSSRASKKLYTDRKA